MSVLWKINTLGFPFLAKTFKPWLAVNPKLNLFHALLRCYLIQNLKSTSPSLRACGFQLLCLQLTCFPSVLSSQNEKFNWNHFPVVAKISPACALLFVPDWCPAGKSRGCWASFGRQNKSKCKNNKNCTQSQRTEKEHEQWSLKLNRRLTTAIVLTIKWK